MGGYSAQAAAAIAATITLLVLFTIAGNALVILAVLRSRALRAPQNLFLVSLAAADILVAALIIPFSLANELMGYWYFQKTWCEIYLALDVLFCTASIVHLCAISLDRYCSVSRAVAYGARRTRRRVKCGIVVVWSIAALISLPPLLYKGEEAAAAPGGRPQCRLNGDAWYVLSSSVGSFFAPCLIMILVYLRIYLIAKRRHRPGRATGATDPPGGCQEPGDPPTLPNRTSLISRKEPVLPQPVPEPPEPQGCPLGTAHPKDTPATDTGCVELAPGTAHPRDTLATGMGCPKDTLSMGMGRVELAPDTMCPTDTLAMGTGHVAPGTVCPEDTLTTGTGCVELAPDTMHPRDTLATGTGCMELAPGTGRPKDTLATGTGHMAPAPGTGRPKDTLATGTGRVALAPGTGSWRRKAQLRRERRVTAVLAVVVGVFVLCWFPFFFLYSLGALCPRRCKVPDGVFQFFFWIGYCNSSLNPLIYTVFNADFRRAFRRLLCGRGTRTAC